MLPRAGRLALSPGWVQTQRGVITQVGAGRCPHPSDLSAAGQGVIVISPGLVDAHLHLPQFDSIGRDGLTLLDWLERIIFPAEMKWADADYAGHMATRVAERLRSCGTTSCAAYGTVHARGTEAAMHALAGTGIRAAVGQVLMDQSAPPELLRPADELIRSAGEFLARWPAGGGGGTAGRVEFAITPRFAVSCSGSLLRGCGELAAASASSGRHAMIQTHLAEMIPECDLVRRIHGAENYTSIYDQAGLLTNRTVLAHGIWLSQEEHARIRDRRSMIAHCPTANTFLKSGEFSWSEARTRGVPIVLGSDIGGGCDVSMVRVARAALEASKRCALRDPAASVLTAAELWWQMTAGNAAMLGWTSTGRLEAGCEADLMIAAPSWGCDALARISDGDTTPELQSEALSWLLHAWDDRWLVATMVGGRLHCF